MSDNKSNRLFQKAHGDLNNTVRCKVMLWGMSGGGMDQGRKPCWDEGGVSFGEGDVSIPKQTRTNFAKWCLPEILTLRTFLPVVLSWISWRAINYGRWYTPPPLNWVIDYPTPTLTYLRIDRGLDCTRTELKRIIIILSQSYRYVHTCVLYIVI